MAGLSRHLEFCPSPTPHEKTLDEEYNVICLFNSQLESRSGLTSTVKYLNCFFFPIGSIVNYGKIYTYESKVVHSNEQVHNGYLQGSKSVPAITICPLLWSLMDRFNNAVTACS
jgi:hypothetical protein